MAGCLKCLATPDPENPKEGLKYSKMKIIQASMFGVHVFFFLGGAHPVTTIYTGKHMEIHRKNPGNPMVNSFLVEKSDLFGQNPAGRIEW